MNIMNILPSRATLPGIEHHDIDVNGTRLHYVSGGTEGTPVLLVHGFPESWWIFRKVIPLLAAKHRVFAVDLRGFGDSGEASDNYDSQVASQDIHALLSEIAVGPVHLVGQDISGPTIFRLAADHPEQVRSLAAIETGLPGFGLEALADVTHGGAWHIGFLTAPGIPEMLLPGNERAFLEQYAFAVMCKTPGAFTDEDINEFERVYSRDNGFKGAAGLYRQC